jgi:hypothetical protein
VVQIQIGGVSQKKTMPTSASPVSSFNNKRSINSGVDIYVSEFSGELVEHFQFDLNHQI